MLFNAYKRSIVQEYALEMLKEHGISPYHAIAVAEKYALELYLENPSVNSAYKHYMVLRNSMFIFNQKTNTVYKRLSISPVDVVVKTLDGATETKDQEFMMDCIAIDNNSVKTRLGFIAVHKTEKYAVQILKSDLESKTVLFNVDFQPLHRFSKDKSKMMHISDFSRQYDVVVQAQFEQFLNAA